MMVGRRRIGPMSLDTHAHHSHEHHHHAVAPDADRRRLAAALALILAFMVAEVVAGLIAGSLALLSDAAHMLTDAGSLALALVAARLAARPPSARFTFGLGRAEVLSAQVNGAALLVLAGVIAIEAVQRFASPPEVEGGIVLAVGLLGAAVNVAAAWQLARAERRSLNVEGARAHVLADLYASLGAAAAGAVVLLTGFREADPIAALLVAGADAPLGLEPAARGVHGAARGHPVRRAHRGRRSRSRGCARHRRGPRPARVGGHRGLPRAGRARARARRATTATAAGASSSSSCTTASGSTTRRCRWTTRPSSELLDIEDRR